MNDLRRWMDIVLCEAVEPYAYHITPAGNLAVIAVEGLQPQAPGPDGWPEYDDDEYADEDESEDPPRLPPEALEGRVFLWDDLGVAKTYARGYSTDVVILRTPLADLDWESGQTDFRYLYTTQPIPPKALEVLGPDGQWHRL